MNKTLTAHGVAIEVGRVEGERPRWVIVGPRYRCEIPPCGCERALCVGRCPAAGKKVRERDAHNSAHCHGGLGYGMHAEHVEVLAAKVLDSYAPKHCKPWTPGTVTLPGLMGNMPDEIQVQLDIALAERKAQGLKPGVAEKVPNVGAARDPHYTIGHGAFLPLDGEETVVAVPWAHYDRWVVKCDAVRCRDEHGRTATLNEHPTRSMADREVERHKAWHVEQRTGVAQPVRQGLMLPPADMREGDWYHNAGGWQRIALIVPTPTQVRIEHKGWREGWGLIATLDTCREYLIVRADECPDWTPVYDRTKGTWVEPDPAGVSA